VTQPTLITDADTPTQALAPVANPTSELIAMIERLASNKDVDVDKLAKILDLQERVLDRNAKAAFDSAFSEMQPEIPTITERGKTDKGRYARLEDIVEIVRPILAKFGFSLSFRTEWPDKATVKVIGVLSHREGYSRESEFMSQADNSGSKNAIQALGSAVSYGRRYTTKDLLNIASRGEDDDGERTERAGQPEAPDGYDDWQADMEACAADGWPALAKAFGKSASAFRNRATRVDKAWWNTLKGKAEQVRA
jgi:ERF superfamily protein